MRIWDVESGALVATLPGQPAEIGAVAFSPDGASVATGAKRRDRAAVRCGLGDRRPGAAWPPIRVRSVAFSPDGSLLASVDGTTVRVWALDIDDLLEIARQNVTRSLTDEECRQYLHVEPLPGRLR